MYGCVHSQPSFKYEYGPYYCGDYDEEPEDFELMKLHEEMTLKSAQDQQNQNTERLDSADGVT